METLCCFCCLFVVLGFKRMATPPSYVSNPNRWVLMNRIQGTFFFLSSTDFLKSAMNSVFLCLCEMETAAESLNYEQQGKNSAPPTRSSPEGNKGMGHWRGGPAAPTAPAICHELQKAQDSGEEVRAYTCTGNCTCEHVSDSQGHL